MGTNYVKIIHIKVVHLRATISNDSNYLIFKRKYKENTNIQSQQLGWTKKATKRIAWEYSATALENLNKMICFYGNITLQKSSEDEHQLPVTGKMEKVVQDNPRPSTRCSQSN